MGAVAVPIAMALVLAAPAFALQEGSGGESDAPVGLSRGAVIVLAIAAVAGCAALARVRWFRPAESTGPAWRLSGAVSLLGFIAALLAGTAAAQMAVAVMSVQSEGATLSPLARSAVVGLAAAVAQLVVIGVLLRIGKRRASTFSPSQTPAPLVTSFALMLATTVLAWPALLLISVIAVVIESQLTGPVPQLGHETLRQMAETGTSDAWWWVTAVSAAVIAPCVEEPLNRGFLQQGFKGAGFPRWVAVCVAAAVFSMMHWTALPDGARLSGLCALLVLGLLWGWLYERTGRFSVCIVAHGMFNVINLLTLAQGQSAPGQ